jgi:hypothetical protein
MCRIQTFAKPKQVLAIPQLKSAREVRQMLRDIAFVLHMTRKVKSEILADRTAKSKECVPA